MWHKRIGVLLLLLAVLLAGCGRKEYREAVGDLESGAYAEAIPLFEEAIEAERNVGDSWRGIGIAKWETEDYEGAAEAFENALQNGSEETGTIYNFLGACRMKLGDPAGAIEYYERGVLQEDCTEEVRREMKFNVIAAYEELKDWDSARAKLAEYTAEYPDDKQAAKEAEFLGTR